MSYLLRVAFFQTQSGAPELTTGGWIFMIGAWLGILLLATFCFSKILRPKAKKGDSPDRKL
jgi:hypothetical protein